MMQILNSQVKKMSNDKKAIISTALSEKNNLFNLGVNSNVELVPNGINIYVLYLLNLGATVLSYWLFAYKNSCEII